MIKAKPEMIELLSKEGIELRQRGRLFWALCPLHSESTPSFCVDSERQRFHCFGCHASGDSIDFIMKYRGLSFLDALQYFGINGDTRPARPDPLELKKREAVRKFRRWEQLYRRAISELLRLANRIDFQVTSPECFDLPGISEMYMRRLVLEYHLDILNSNDDKTKFELYKEVTRGTN